MRDPQSVRITTDGACRGNPGPGGIGVVLEAGGRSLEISRGYRLTTNNRMELTAAIEGLSALKRPCKVDLVSDSRYLVESMRNGWVLRWKANNWKKKENKDLWTRLLELCDRHEVTFHWVKGHADHPVNTRCDALAVAAATGTDLIPDEGYEAERKRKAAQADLF